MSGASEINIENVLRHSIRNGRGYMQSSLISDNSFWLLDRSQIPNTGANLVTRVASATDLDVFRWAGTAAAATQRIVTKWVFPFNGKVGQERAGEKPVIHLCVRARCYASVPVGQFLQCQAWWRNPAFDQNYVESNGDAALSTHTAIDGVLAPAAAASNIEASREITFDITAAMTAAQRIALRPGATFTFKLGPKINLTTETIEVESATIRFIGHSASYYQALRDIQ